MTTSARIQNAGDCPSGAHLQMCSYHGCCTHNDASCPAQHPNSAGPSNTTAIGAGHCYFCRTRAHPTTDPVHIADKYECTGPWPAHIEPQQCLYRVFSCRSGFSTNSVISLAIAAAEIWDAGQGKPINNAKNDW
uniref:Uncharacterized protein n=1 Tax=Romanomermis culicivorax TaxID=13658 RepID=A0A915ICS5_ROMCU